MPGKNELPAALFGTAGVIATDDHTQCLEPGDFGNAVPGVAEAGTDLSVGAVLRDCVPHRTELSIADLTGVGAADAAVASTVFAALA